MAVVLSATLVLTGCTQTSAGTPMPGEDTVTTSSEPDTTGSTEPSDERPREIDLNGKDPCVIPQTDWPALGIERPGEPDEHPDFKSPDCHYSGVGNVTLVVTAGIGTWTEENYNAEITDVDSIDGYRTISVASNVVRQTCFTVVDVADNQFLLTTASPNPNDPSKPERCDLAYQLAESAMNTLVAS